MFPPITPLFVVGCKIEPPKLNAQCAQVLQLVALVTCTLLIQKQHWAARVFQSLMLVQCYKCISNAHSARTVEVLLNIEVGLNMHPLSWKIFAKSESARLWGGAANKKQCYAGKLYRWWELLGYGKCLVVEKVIIHKSVQLIVSREQNGGERLTKGQKMLFICSSQGTVTAAVLNISSIGRAQDLDGRRPANCPDAFLHSVIGERQALNVILCTSRRSKTHT